MPIYNANLLNTQNDLLLQNLLEFYREPAKKKMFLHFINGESHISLRIIDWFVTNYAKKQFTIYELVHPATKEIVRFKVYNDYKQKLRAYSKKRFDPFCRWERIQIPFDDGTAIETTIGQLNFFKWAIENKILEYIDDHYEDIESDMVSRNTSSKHRNSTDSSLTSVETNTTNESDSNTTSETNSVNKTRKKRQELSISACKCIRKEAVKVLVKFN